MTAGYLLDTNHVGVAVSPKSVVWERISELRAKGARLGACVPVLCEIETGIRAVKHPDVYRANLAKLLRQVRVWPMDLTTARHFGALAHDLRQRGRVLSQVDIMLATLARQMNLIIVTSDADFAALPDVTTENWLPSGHDPSHQ